MILKDSQVLKVLNVKSLEHIEKNYLIPHFSSKNYFIDGQECSKPKVSKITVTKSFDTSNECVNIFCKQGEVTIEDELKCIFENKNFIEDITSQVCQKVKRSVLNEDDWIKSQLENFKRILDFKINAWLVGIKFLLLTIIGVYIGLIYFFFNDYIEKRESLISLLFTIFVPVISAGFFVITGRKFNPTNEWNNIKKKIEVKVHQKNNFNPLKYKEMMKK
ncbi:hypothetical protein [uncultured Croceitalea sp.]|uniref:hypothetical protein n=1 Tax=uncultured Croceitalea sp. TaxID=1798908 RepID=UPI003305FEE5